MASGSISPGPPALLPAVRGVAAAAASLAAVVFLVLAVRYAGGTVAGRLDIRVDAVVDTRFRARLWPLRLLLLFGEPATVSLLVIVFAGAAMACRRRRLALLAVVGPGLTGVATTVLKPVVGRVIAGDNFAFPSGHTGGFTSLGLLAALGLIGALPPSRTVGSLILAVGALLPGAAMGVALIASNWHYPTDAIGGFCAAVGMVLGSAVLIEHIADSRARLRHPL